MYTFYWEKCTRNCKKKYLFREKEMWNYSMGMKKTTNCTIKFSTTYVEGEKLDRKNNKNDEEINLDCIVEIINIVIGDENAEKGTNCNSIASKLCIMYFFTNACLL